MISSIAVWLRSSPSSLDRSMRASRSGPLIRMRTLWSLPFASVTRLVASRRSSGVSPSAIDLVAMNVTWLTLGTRSKSPRMNGMLKRPSIGRTSPAIWGSRQRAAHVQQDVDADLGREVVAGR